MILAFFYCYIGLFKGVIGSFHGFIGLFNDFCNVFSIITCGGNTAFYIIPKKFYSYLGHGPSSLRDGGP